MITRDLQIDRAERLFIIAVFCLLLSTITATAQTASFTYQGRFTDGGTAANGTYDMQFKLFDGNGNQIGSTITNNAVLVSSGIFAVQLDYGAASFSGGDRFLELGVRLAGTSDPYTVLAPRQQLTSTPYAIRAGSTMAADNATNASQLGGVAANQYVQTGDARLTDPRPPTSGSPSYIQNTNGPQIANFNISGNGTAAGTLSAGAIDAATQYNLGGARVLSGAGVKNLFAGANAGASNAPVNGNSFVAANNSFFGASAGAANTTGSENSFFGANAGSGGNGSGNSFFGKDSGAANSGTGNSFFGQASGMENTTGYENSFFGMLAGKYSSNGFRNSYFGGLAGLLTTSGFLNSFFGYDAGQSNSTGSQNTFIGGEAGFNNYDGAYNTFVGSLSGYYGPHGNYNTTLGYFSAAVNLTNATAIGAYAQATQSNSLILGSINGVNDAVADTNVGIGTTAPKARLHISTNGGNILFGNAGCSSSFAGIGFGSSLSGCTNYSFLGNGTDTIINRPTGGTIAFRENNTTQMSIASGGAVSITTLGSAGSTTLCRNASNQISTCSSSLRYKTNIQPFSGGLSVLNRLRPITFDWKQGGMHDLGFGAEEIAAVEPLLVTHNDKGEVEGVKYDRISAVLVNAVKEQQAQFLVQQGRIKQQQDLITAQQAQLRLLHQEVITLKQLVTNHRHHRARQR